MREVWMISTYWNHSDTPLGSMFFADETVAKNIFNLIRAERWHYNEWNSQIANDEVVLDEPTPSFLFIHNQEKIPLGDLTEIRKVKVHLD